MATMMAACLHRFSPFLTSGAILQARSLHKTKFPLQLTGIAQLARDHHMWTDSRYKTYNTSRFSPRTLSSQAHGYHTLTDSSSFDLCAPHAALSAQLSRGCCGARWVKHCQWTDKNSWVNLHQSNSAISFTNSRAFHSATWCTVRGYAKKAKKEKVVKGGKKKVALTSEELDGVLDVSRLQQEMQEAVEEFRQQLIQQVSVRTNIGVYDSLPVKTEDGVFPLIQLGQIVQKNPTLILVNMAASPQYIVAVKEAISQSGLNVNPQQEGTTIYIPVPKVTREHREGLAKNAKMLHDKAKTKLRDIHNKYTKKVKGAKEHHSEDVIKGAQDMVLDEMHSYGLQLDSLLHAKQEELLGSK